MTFIWRTEMMLPVIFSAIFMAMALMLFGATCHADANDLTPVQFNEPPQHQPVVLVENGVPRGRIVVADGRSQPLNRALQELQEVIELTTGTKLPLITGQPEGGEPTLVIGDCTASRDAGIDPDAMPAEGFVIRTAPNRVFIVGSSQAAPHGTAWGVIEFMERFMNVRWYWPAERGGRSIVPNRDLIVQPVWLEDAPVLRMRNNWPPFGNGPDGTHQNLVHHHTMLRHGSTWPVQLVVHTPRSWHTIKEYVENRPEVFQLRSDGTRNFHMLCYSNPLTLQTYIEEIARVYDDGERADGSRMGIRGDAITVSPADMGISCRCEDCQRLWDADAGRYGRASRIMAEFVNKLAHAVKERWPDKTIIFLPYTNYTEAPDGYEFPGNVEVQICGMPGIAQYKEPQLMQWEQNQIDGWIRITGRPIQNWHYSCWPEDRTKAPYQYPNVLVDYYRKNRGKIVGTFINGGGDHWPRQHISMYVWMKAMWNPEINVDAVVAEHCRRMYGPAADTMHELMNLQIDGWEQSRWQNAAISPKAIYEHSYPPETVERMKRLLAQARQQIGDDTVLRQRLDYYEIPFKDFYAEFDFVVHGKGVQPLIVQKVEANPVIDGKLDDEAWQKAEPVFFGKHAGGRQVEAQFPTELRAVSTLDGVTFAFKMNEPNTGKLLKDITAPDDALLWHQDCVEIFLDTTGKNLGEYCQFIISAAGTIWDADKGDTAWNMDGIKAGVHIDDGCWSLEVFLPLAGFPGEQRPRIGTGVQWYGQFTRHRNQNGKTTGGFENQKLNANFGGFNSNIADFAPVIFRE